MNGPSDQELVEAARSWIGTPWRHQGRGIRGVDCVGLLIRIAHDFELTDFDITGYTRRAKGRGFEEHFDQRMDRISVLDVSESDVVIFADTTYACHCAFYSESKGYPTLIHAHALHRKVIEEPYSDAWKNKAMMAFQFRHLNKKGAR